jgi:hypothetical protein
VARVGVGEQRRHGGFRSVPGHGARLRYFLLGDPRRGVGIGLHVLGTYRLLLAMARVGVEARRRHGV